MVGYRRGGRQSNGVGRRKRPRPSTTRRRRSQSSSEDNSSDGDSITRCVCGETHSIGLMVQCDKCEVWQHCECMGLEQPDIPDQYFCEKCKPENHKTIRLSSGSRVRRQYVPNETKTPKKRMTLNSREASMSLEDVLAARNALEMYEREQEEHHSHSSNSNSTSPSPSSIAVTPTREEKLDLPLKRERSNTSLNGKDDNDNDERPIKRKIESPEIAEEEVASSTPGPVSSTVSVIGQDSSTETPKQTLASDTEGLTEMSTDKAFKSLSTSPTSATPTSITPTSKPRRRQAAKNTEDTSSPTFAKRRGTGRNTTSRSTGSRRGKPRSRTSTPVPDGSPVATAPSEIDDDAIINESYSSTNSKHTKNATPSSTTAHRHNHRSSSTNSATASTSHSQLNNDSNYDNDDNISTLIFQHFSPQARASSPPAKARHPSARMSISEMNRRANQILEYISSIQVEMATKESISSGHHAGHEMKNKSFSSSSSSSTSTAATNLSNGASINGINSVNKKRMKNGHRSLADEEAEEDDDNDSLSSASTIPLDKEDRNINDSDEESDDDDDDNVDRNNQTSLEIMDRLTRKLIKFQRKFGSRNRALYEEALLEGEGRITRSREASTMNAFRNMLANHTS